MTDTEPTALQRAAAADLFRRPPHRHLDVGAGEVAVRSVGTGPDVLFVHGWPVSGATFRTVLPHLSAHVTCHVIDLPGAGDSHFDSTTPISVDRHIETVRRVVDLLGFDDIAVVGHDSGGLIARHALAGDGRIRAFGLIDTEQPQGLSPRFRTFLAARHVPGIGRMLGWAVGRRMVRRHPLILGGAFTDHALLDGEFDEFFLQPLHSDPARLSAAIRMLDSFDPEHARALGDVHLRIDVPVQLVWGADDPFFPVRWAEEMVSTFPQASLHVVRGARLFSHEEQPAEVAAALLPTLLTSPAPPSTT